MKILSRRGFLAAASALPLLAARPRAWPDALHAMDTWFWGSKTPIPEQVALLKKLGFAGLAGSTGHSVKEYLAALQEQGLEMSGVYTPVPIDGDYPKVLPELVETLKGTKALVWLALTSKAHKKSDPAGDEAALKLVSRLADDCEKAGLPGIAFYPHVGFWMERVGDAVRLAAQAKRPGVGVQLNLYHWMATEPGADPKKSVDEAKAHLKGVSINGSGKKASILPLGEGDYDPLALLKALAEAGYAGPVAHQGYGIKGDTAARLAAAKEAWEKLKARLRP